jgi:hypothetical protein
MRYKLFEEFIANKEQALEEAMIKPIHKKHTVKNMKPITDKTKPETAKPAKSGSLKDMKAMLDTSKAKAPTAKHSAASPAFKAGKSK